MAAEFSYETRRHEFNYHSYVRWRGMSLAVYIERDGNQFRWQGTLYRHGMYSHTHYSPWFAAKSAAEADANHQARKLLHRKITPQNAR
ncbi:MAG: hypothetical protein AAF787_00195 [Chloroflexota bacterium]